MLGIRFFSPHDQRFRPVIVYCGRGAEKVPFCDAVPFGGAAVDMVAAAAAMMEGRNERVWRGDGMVRCRRVGGIQLVGGERHFGWCGYDVGRRTVGG